MEVAASELGHASTEMVRRVYARFKPKEEEIRRWEHLAEARDAEMARVAKSR